MKRMICMVLAILLFFTGCGFSAEKEDTVRFCYCRNSVSYGVEDGVLAWEERTLSGLSQDLESLLALYLQGPLSTDLTLPLPTGADLIHISRTDDDLILTFNDKFSLAQGMDLTILGLCISSTCFSLCDTGQVSLKVKSGSTVFTIRRDQEVILFDPLPSDISENTED